LKLFARSHVGFIMGPNVYERSQIEGRIAELMTRARAGENIFIAEQGEVVARLIPGNARAALRRNEPRAGVRMPPQFEPADARLARMQAESAVPRAMRNLSKH
jgi:antitoxin (DNA-binding transcriptional repressor) of toxin-antitoxin stability system